LPGRRVGAENFAARAWRHFHPVYFSAGLMLEPGRTEDDATAEKDTG
jgi:hypothetical protein